jgi:hypothetical protein
MKKLILGIGFLVLIAISLLSCERNQTKPPRLVRQPWDFTFTDKGMQYGVTSSMTNTIWVVNLTKDSLEIAYYLKKLKEN